MKITKKQQKTLIGVTVIGLILLFAKYQLDKRSGNASSTAKLTDDEIKESGNSVMNGQDGTDTSPFEMNKVLFMGSNGKEVLLAQRQINKLAELLNRAFPSSEVASSDLSTNNYGSAGGFDFDLLTEDGRFGAKTKEYFNSLLKKDSGSFYEVLVKVSDEIDKVYLIRPDLKGTEKENAVSGSAFNVLNPLTWF